MDTTGDQRIIGQASWFKGDKWPNVTDQIYRCCPLGAPGDVLLGKETYFIGTDGSVIYKATSYFPDASWRSPVTMPRAAIRRRWTVKSVRACLAEDIVAFPPDDDTGRRVQDNYGPSDWLWYAEVEAVHG
jgi:hypothetical protein